MEKEYKNVVYLFLVLFVCVLLGFYKPYFGTYPNFDKSITIIVHVHALALIIWLLLLVIQPLLIRIKKIRIHLLLGKFTYFLVPVIIVTSLAVINKQYHEGIEQKLTPLNSLKALFIPIAEILLFALFYLIAIIKRKISALHMRYIICNSLILITPAMARITGYWLYIPQFNSYCIAFLMTDLLLITLILFDRRKKLNSGPYILALILFFIFHATWYLAGNPF